LSRGWSRLCLGGRLRGVLVAALQNEREEETRD
jgi:hypothetical protein